jgi:DNA repair exonuclease SbcCD ATPase subunit
MAIPSVVQGTIEVDEGKVFELDSPRGAAWLESIGSFRYEPICDSKAYTVRKEPSGYWYGCRKIAGTVRKKYIGKSSELTPAKLDEIAVALEDSPPPVPRVNKVAEVAQKVTQSVQVTEKVAEVAQDRLTALELEVASLRKALEALQEVLPGKLELGDSTELPKVADKVADKVAEELQKSCRTSKVAEELQNELGNLKAENEKLRADYDALLESSTVITNKLREEVREVRSQLEQERADRGEVEAKLTDREEQMRQLLSELAELKQKSATARELPEAADLLNQLKSQRKKSKADLTDLEAILEILES